MKKAILSGPLLIVLCATICFAKTLYTKVNVTNIRNGPSTKYPIICKLSKGTGVEILEEEDAWHQVKLPGGTTGWVHSSLVSDSRTHAAKLLESNYQVKELIEMLLDLQKAVPEERGEFETVEEYNRRVEVYKQECKQKLLDVKNKIYKVKYRYKKYPGDEGLEFSLRKYDLQNEGFPIEFSKYVYIGSTTGGIYPLYYTIYYDYVVDFRQFPSYLKIDKESARKVREHEKGLFMDIVFAIKECYRKESNKYRGDWPVIDKCLVIEVLEASLTDGQHIFWNLQD